MLAAGAGGAQESSVPLYDNLGTHHYSITVSDPQAQRYFDQGLRLYYAFNHQEAIRAFTEAARLDPACAMCHWGIALALGPNINAPMDPAAVEPALAALEMARQGQASEVERALIEALVARYASPPPEDRSALDLAYAEAMGKVVQRYPDNHEAATLHAEALMDQPLALLGSRWRAAAAHAADPGPAGAGHCRQSPASGRLPLLHPCRGGGGSAARGALCRASGRPDAGCRTSGAHAGTHLCAGRSLRGRDSRQRARGTRRRDLHPRSESGRRGLWRRLLPSQLRLPGLRRQHARPQRAGIGRGAQDRRAGARAAVARAGHDLPAEPPDPSPADAGALQSLG